MSDGNALMRECPGCGLEQPKDQFFDPNGNPRMNCETCRAKVRPIRPPRKSNPRTEQRQRERARERLLASMGITEEQYVLVLDDQGGTCAICRSEPTSGKRLSIDHDHRTGVVRGLLCFHCNNMLGVIEKFGDRASAYLTANGSGHPLLDGAGPRTPLPVRRWPYALGEDAVREIRRRYAEERITQKALAIEYQTTMSVIGGLVRGIRWATREDRYREVLQEVQIARRKLSDDDMVDVRSRFEKGETKASIAKSYGVMPSTILARLRQVGAC